jgi:hypothetical protein
MQLGSVVFGNTGSARVGVCFVRPKRRGAGSRAGQWRLLRYGAKESLKNTISHRKGAKRAMVFFRIPEFFFASFASLR